MRWILLFCTCLPLLANYIARPLVYNLSMLWLSPRGYLETQTGAHSVYHSFREEIAGAPWIGGSLLAAITTSGKLVVYDLNQRKELWRAATNGIVAGNSGVFYGRESGSADQVLVADLRGQITAWESASGKQLWNTDIETPVYSGVLYEDGRVFIPALDGRLIALDAFTGKKIWDVRLARRIAGAVPVVTGETRDLILGSLDGRIHVIQPATGKILRQTDTGSGIASPLIEVSGRWVFLSSGSEIVTCDPAGKVIWKKRVPGLDLASFMVRNESVYVIRGSRLERMALDDGRLISTIYFPSADAYGVNYFPGDRRIYLPLNNGFMYTVPGG